MKRGIEPRDRTTAVCAGSLEKGFYSSYPQDRRAVSRRNQRTTLAGRAGEYAQGKELLRNTGDGVSDRRFAAEVSDSEVGSDCEGGREGQAASAWPSHLRFFTARQGCRGQTQSQQRNGCGLGNLLPRVIDLIAKTETQVIDSETGGFGTYQAELQTGNHVGAVFGDQTQEFDAQAVIGNLTDQVARAVERPDCSAANRVEVTAIQANASDVLIEKDRNRTVERRGSRQNGRGRVGSVVGDKRLRRGGIQSQETRRRADNATAQGCTGRAGSPVAQGLTDEVATEADGGRVWIGAVVTRCIDRILGSYGKLGKGDQTCFGGKIGSVDTNYTCLCIRNCAQRDRGSHY